MSISLLLTSLLLANPLVLLSSYVSMGNSFPKPLTEEEEEIYLTAYEENVTEDEPVAVLSFDENNTELQFDVSAYDRAETVYSIASINKSAFLCCEVDEDTLCHFTYASILAHCFWEITSYSFA